MDATFHTQLGLTPPRIGRFTIVATALVRALARMIAASARGESVGHLLTTPSASAQMAMLPRREQERLLDSGAVGPDRSRF